MNPSCDVCGSTEGVHEWGCSHPHPPAAHICERCEEKIVDTLENALLQRCPEHFKETLTDAIGDFCVSDRETDILDVVWNLSDQIRIGWESDGAFLWGQYKTEEEREAIIFPTPQEYKGMMEDFIKAFHPQSPRYDENPDVMDWGMVSILFKEVKA